GAVVAGGLSSRDQLGGSPACTGGAGRVRRPRRIEAPRAVSAPRGLRCHRRTGGGHSAVVPRRTAGRRLSQRAGVRPGRAPVSALGPRDGPTLARGGSAVLGPSARGRISTPGQPQLPGVLHLLSASRVGPVSEPVGGECG